MLYLYEIRLDPTFIRLIDIILTQFFEVSDKFVDDDDESNPKTAKHVDGDKKVKFVVYVNVNLLVMTLYTIVNPVTDVK